MEFDGCFEPARLLRRARRIAGLTQRELAERAETSQSVVARIESGTTSPTAATLDRLLTSAGFELEARLIPRPVLDSHMLEDVERILALSPSDRIREVGNLARLETAARPLDSGREHTDA